MNLDERPANIVTFEATMEFFESRKVGSIRVMRLFLKLFCDEQYLNVTDGSRILGISPAAHTHKLDTLVAAGLLRVWRGDRRSNDMRFTDSRMKFCTLSDSFKAEMEEHFGVKLIDGPPPPC